MIAWCWVSLGLSFAGAVCYADDLVFWHLLRQPWGSCWTVVRILLLFVALSLIPLRHSWYVSPLTLLPLALPAFSFDVSNLLFLTLSHILVIFFNTISVIYCTTWLIRKANCLFASFPRDDPYIDSIISVLLPGAHLGRKRKHSGNTRLKISVYCYIQ